MIKESQSVRRKIDPKKTKSEFKMPESKRPKKNFVPTKVIPFNFNQRVRVDYAKRSKRNENKTRNFKSSINLKKMKPERINKDEQSFLINSTKVVPFNFSITKPRYYSIYKKNNWIYCEKMHLGLKENSNNNFFNSTVDTSIKLLTAEFRKNSQNYTINKNALREKKISLSNQSKNDEKKIRIFKATENLINENCLEKKNLKSKDKILDNLKMSDFSKIFKLKETKKDFESFLLAESVGNKSTTKVIPFKFSQTKPREYSIYRKNIWNCERMDPNYRDKFKVKRVNTETDRTTELLRLEFQKKIYQKIDQ